MTNQSDILASNLDLTFTIEKNGKLSTKPYDKCDDFDFQIVNFPFQSSNIPSISGPSHGVYITQLIRYARCCSYYEDFRHCHKMLVERLVSQGYLYEHLRNFFKKFYGRYRDLIVRYQRSVSGIVRIHSLLIPNSNGLSFFNSLIWTSHSDCQLI